MFTRLLVLGIVFTVASIDPAVGQDAPRSSQLGYPFITNFGPRSYDAEQSNWGILQDRRGIMYFANGYGLLEYDGATWRLLELPNKAQVRSMAMDDHGTVFVGGVGDLGYLEADELGRTKFVSLHQAIPEEARDYADVWRTQVLSGNIYFDSDNHIFRWDGREMSVWNATESFHVSFVVGDSYYIREWQRGLMKLEDDELSLVPGGEQFALERIYVILPYDDERILIGTRTQGFFLYDGSEFRPFRTEVDAYVETHQLYLPGAVLDDGTFAVGTLTGGLVRFDRDGRHVQTLNKSVGLADNSVYYVATDRNGDLWLALSVGIAHVETSSAYSILDSRSGLVRLPTGTARNKGVLYVSTNDGVNLLDEETSLFRPVEGINEQVFTILNIAGDLLVGGTQTGVFRIEGERASLLVGAPDRTYSTQWLHGSISDENVAFASLQETVLAMRKDGDGSWVEVGQSPTMLNRPFVTAEEREGVLWVGTGTGGVYRLTYRSENGVPDLPAAEAQYFGVEQGLPEVGTYPFRVGGRMYFTSRGTFYRFDEASYSFVGDPTLEVVTGDGGNYDQVWEDPLGRVWVALGGEAAVGTPLADGYYDWNTAPFRRLAGSANAHMYPEEDGTVWFSTLDGLLRYSPNRDEGSPDPSSAMIRRVVAGEDSLIYGGVASDDFASPRLEYSLNAVQFDYSIPSYIESDKNRFQTMLEGFDPHWSAWVRETRRAYTNIPPGDYTFRVRARNINDIVSEEATFALTVLPPWYRTWWAYLAYLGLIGGLIYGFVHIRTGKIEARRRELEQTVVERTSEIKQRVEELAVINGVQRGLAAELDMQGIYDLVGDRIRDLFDAQVVVIRTFDHDEGVEIFRYAVEKGVRMYIEPRPIDGFARHLIETRNAIVIKNRFAEYVGQFSDEISTEGDEPKSAVFVPLVVGGSIRGNVSLQNVDRENAFSDSDVSLLTTLANSMSVALENARLFDETSRLLRESDQRAAEMVTVNEISKALVSQLEFDALIQLVGAKIQETFQADMAYVALLSRDEGMIDFPYGYGDEFPPMKYGKGLTSQIIQTGEPLLINEDVKGTFDELGLEEVGKTSASYLGVPVRVGRDVVGVISVQSSSEEGRFDDDDTRLLTTIAANVGVALQNAESYRALNATLQNLKSTQEQLVTQEKMASLGQLTAGIAHEIKNPLNFVNNFAELNHELAEDVISELNNARGGNVDDVYPGLFDLVTSLKTNALQISKHGKRADSIVRNMMQHASDGTGERFRVEVNAFVDEFVGLAYHGMRAQVPDLNVKITRDYDEDAGNVQMVPQELGRVLVNLLNNAMYAVHEREQTEGSDYVPTVNLATQRRNGVLDIRVADNGTGIPENIREHIFEPLFTTKPPGSGTGLGLSLAFDIVTKVHSGRIKVESEVGAGTTFIIEIPA